MADIRDRQKLMLEIKRTDFVLQELNLFLDTHPCSKQALEKFSQFEKMSKQLTEEYERLYGPLTPSVNNNTETWEWIKGPGPWEN